MVPAAFGSDVLLELLGLVPLSVLLLLELLFLFFLCFFFPVVLFWSVPLWSVLEAELPELVPLILPELEPLDWPAEVPCGEVPAPGEEVPDCCAAAIPMEKRAAVAIVRSFLDIRFSCESGD